MAALVKGSRSAVIGVHSEWIKKQETGSQRQAFGRHGLLKVCSEKKFTKAVQSNRRATVPEIAGNLNQRATVNVSEGTVCRTLHRIVYGSRHDLF
ncbi:hypothetical protein TNCV_3825621 [Trichonephila clavipes]|nr:hypothetical protein TNCV_3825621 [Trichonephila clavipes]